MAGRSPLFPEMRRDAETAFMVGLFTGLAVCGVGAVGIALVLIGAAKPLTRFGDLALCWAASAPTCLAFIVAALPLLAYERARGRHYDPEE